MIAKKPVLRTSFSRATFRRVTRTSVNSPSESLVKKLMQESKFDSMKLPVLQWGLAKEDETRAAYLAEASGYQVGLSHTNAGLHVNPNFPHLGASPEAIVNCECCGTGVVEIKCPFKHRDVHPHNVTDPGFYLVHSDDNEIIRSRDNWLFVMWTTVTLSAGPHWVSIVSQFFQTHHSFLTLLNQHWISSL